jgi:hypothetical protein
MQGRKNPAVPFYDDASVISCQAAAAITGKRFVAGSGNTTDGRPRVATAGAGARVFGVAGGDTIANDGVTVYRGSTQAVPVTAGAALTAWQDVESDAAGRAVPLTTGVRAGTVTEDCANGGDAKIFLA